MTYRNHPLTEAARYSDAQCEEQGIEATVASSGLDLEAIVYVAQQRALRLTVLLNRGEQALKKLSSNSRFEVVSLSPTEEAMMESFTLGYLDGMFIGWTARAISDRSGE